MEIYYISSNPVILPEHKEIFHQIGNVHIIQDRKLDETSAIEKLKEAEILIAAPSGIQSISANVINSLPNLKFITTTTTSSEWIDIVAAAKRGIIVSTCKGANAESVAEHNWAMILDLCKRVSEFDRDARMKQACDFSNYTGIEVFGKTIGILGLGDIGTKVAIIANAFNMKILGYNRSVKDLPNVKQVELEELLINSDIISVNLPLSEETKSLISNKEFELMKNNVVIVNTAREEIVEKKAVIENLRSGKVFGYGIETEVLKPILPQDEYLQFPNVLINPHNAFNTQEADRNVKETWVQNIISYVEGKPINIVNN